MNDDRPPVIGYVEQTDAPFARVSSVAVGRRDGRMMEVSATVTATPEEVYETTVALGAPDGPIRTTTVIVGGRTTATVLVPLPAEYRPDYNQDGLPLEDLRSSRPDD